jgi:hypothetical protein
MIEIVGWQTQLIIHVYCGDPFCEGDENRKTFPVYHTEEAGTGTAEPGTRKGCHYISDDEVLFEM